MNFKIPFTFTKNLDKLKRRAKPFKKYIHAKKDSQLQFYLNNTDTNIQREDYIAICRRSAVNAFLISLAVLFLIFALTKVNNALLLAFAVSVMFTILVYSSQILYPKAYVSRKQRNIERNLIAGLEDILVQLNSGIPLFNILVNVSSADYGELSKEFTKVVKEINAGKPQREALEELGEKNPSIYFRRTLWQLSNGMRAGSDISEVIKESIKSLNEEQLIQIQNYGNKLNPMIMFYMLISVIMPALAITFLTIITSMVNLAKTTTILSFAALFVFVVITQFMFLGIIKSLRPSLL